MSELLLLLMLPATKRPSTSELGGEIIADHSVELREDVVRSQHSCVSREGRDEHGGDKRDSSDCRAAVATQ